MVEIECAAAPKKVAGSSSAFARAADCINFVGPRRNADPVFVGAFVLTAAAWSTADMAGLATEMRLAAVLARRAGGFAACDTAGALLSITGTRPARLFAF
jgi:hypothetical protein